MRTGIVSRLKASGFDLSYAVPFERGAVAKCSQCEALAICGVACHETGCPNAMHECKGCDVLLSKRQGSYCDDCL